ncbi:prepilin peptidase [Nocardioides jensenii]|uniref:prepilin peptidase n=1 Tax=Nocardioides jensenii TaxID=1843 RepID=UPI000833B9F5|nr:A24 family peptidase [Nocardioides jensenii]
MDWAAHLDTVVACVVYGAVTGWFVPHVVARLPEPLPFADEETEDEAHDDAGGETTAEPEEPKPLYADLAATPGIAWWTAGWSALVAGLFGATLGWAWPLVYLLPLVPIGVALAWVDLRTRLLPKRIVAPTYLLVIVLLLVCALATGDLDALKRAALGWLIAGFVFWFLWRFTPGMGYGDVRLSGVLGMALGYLGWGEFVVGTYAGFLIGALGWIPLRLLRITNDRNFPFGPFMLVGAVTGVLWGADLAGYLAGRQA